MANNDDEMAAVAALDAEERYEYFVKQVCDCEEIWALKASDGFVVMADETGKQYLPVWPSEAFAVACAGEGEQAEAIPLDAWRERWIPGLLRDNSGIAVFPVEHDSGAAVTPDELRIDVEEELGRFE